MGKSRFKITPLLRESPTEVGRSNFRRKHKSFTGAIRKFFPVSREARCMLIKLYVGISGASRKFMNFPARNFVKNSKLRRAFPVTQLNRQKRLRIDIASSIFTGRQLES